VTVHHPLPQEIIRRKRDGGTLSRHEIETIIHGLARGAVGADQAAAFAMAVFLRGMSPEEAAHLTRAMTQSGTVLDWSQAELDGPVLDKHSTGGVGDNVSLVLAPLVAACGGYVPMISGRGLGHTGGTLDKLDSIPGYRTQPDLDHFQRVVRETGAAIIGQTDDLAPADKRLYAIRDVTATVESIPLITASILSKKLAAGLGGLVMDVKFGSGAFMETHDAARDLARMIVATAHAAGLPTTALLTDMHAPLATSAGNAVEVQHAIDHLTGARREARFMAVVEALAVDMLMLGGLAGDDAQARAKIAAALSSGRAAEQFARMCAALGGPSDILDEARRHLPRAPVVREIHAERSGIISEIDTRALGIAVILLGGGRRLATDRIDHAVGFTSLALPGQNSDDAPLAIVHARDEATAQAAEHAVRAAYRLSDAAPTERPMILERIGKDG
jgi:thymidine phosphorylase